MLILNRQEFNNIIPRIVIDKNFITDSEGNTGALWNAGYLSFIHLHHAALPIHFNDLELKLYTTIGNIDEVKAKVQQLIEAPAPEKTITYHRVYASEDDFDTISELFEEAGTYSTLDDTLLPFFNKMCDDANDREQEHFNGVDLAVKIYYDPSSLEVFELVTRQDFRQMSDVFLILGVLPILFPTLKEKLSPAEEDYFKTLVRRSQIKRINNAIAEKAFEAIVTLEKYKKVMEDVRLKNIMNNILNARIREAQSILNQINDELNYALQDYESKLTAKQDAQRQLLYVEDSLEETKENLESLLDMKCVHNIDTDGSNALLLDIRVPVDNYNPEEAKIILENHGSGAGVLDVLLDIFVEQKYTLYFAHTFKISPGRQAWERTGISPSKLVSLKAMSNPHLKGYNCYGTYQPLLQRAHHEKDFRVFASVAATCVANLNFSDSAVMNTFINALENDSAYYNIKCIEDDNGDMWSFKEIQEGHNLVDIENLEEPEEELEII